MKNIKTRILHLLFPPLRMLNANKLIQKISVVVDTIAAIWLYSVIIFIVYASFSYGKQENMNLTFYYHNNIISNKSVINIKEQMRFLKTDPLYLTSVKAKVYFIEDKNLFAWLLSPALFINYLADKINRVDTTLNAATFFSLVVVYDDTNIKYLEQTVAHELVHVLQNHKYGFIVSFFKNPGWVKEGYATYRALKYKKAVNYARAVSASYRYKAKLVDHAVSTMGATRDELHKGMVQIEEVVDSLCGNENYHSSCKGK